MKAGMLLPLDRMEDPPAVCAAVAALPAHLQDAADAVLLAAGPGGRLPPALAPLAGLGDGCLWRAGVLLPTATVSKGGRIDPRRYAARCRANPALAARQALPDLRTPGQHRASAAPSRARWDAVVLAAAAEHAPLRLTKTGDVHREDEKRFLHRRPGGIARWGLAYAHARASQVLHADQGVLAGRPEARGRRIREPSLLFSEPSARWSAVLLERLKGEWLPLVPLAAALEARLPTVLAASGLAPRGAQLLRWLRHAADALQRLDRVEVERAADGPVAFRSVRAQPALAPGCIVTSDLEIFVAPGELEAGDYGRLCRLAPYVDGDVVSRHRLSEEGLRRDRLAGGQAPLEFLQHCSRRPVPPSVEAALSEWQRRAGRVVLWSGASVLEEDGSFRRLDAEPPPGAWMQRGDPEAPTALVVEGDVLRAPKGSAPLRLRRAMAQVSGEVVQGTEGWEAHLAAQRLADPASVEAVLAGAHCGPLPGAVRAAVWAGALDSPVRPEPAVLLRMPRRLADALLDDPEAASLVQDVPGQGGLVVSSDDLPGLRARLLTLGIPISDP